MVGRGWWVLVWTVCAGWTVCAVYGGQTCQPGQEFFSGRKGQCVPCTRCHDPQVVVVPCYVYQDAVCAPAAQFVPNWSQPGRPQLPITLSTFPPAPRVGETHVRGRQKAVSSTERKETNLENYHSGEPASRENDNRAQSETTFLAPNNSKKNSKKHPRHNRHRHKQDLRHQNQSSEPQTEESKANSVIVYKKSGAHRGVDTLANIGKTEVVSRNSGDMESTNSNGATSGNEIQDNDLKQPDVAGWKETLSFAVIITVSICLVVLTIATLSHLQNVLTRRKLKRVYDGLPCDNVGEARVMEQLVPSSPDVPAPVVATRSTVTYIRATTPTSSTPSSSTITTTTAATSVETHPTSGHVYPLNPFTMDRLLEQRRVLGPASSVDTNLYIESWQQQDNQQPGNTLPCTSSPLRGSVSACPSPAPVRSYRPGPASASASPTISVRGLNIPRGHVRASLAPHTSVPSGGGAGGWS